MTDSENIAETEPATFKEKLRHAFAVGDEFEETLEEDEEALLRDIARRIDKRGLSTMVIMFLYPHRQLNLITANLVQMGQWVFEIGPVTAFLRQFLGPNYTHECLVRTMEKRCSVDRLVEILEELSDERT